MVVYTEHKTKHYKDNNRTWLVTINSGILTIGVSCWTLDNRYCRSSYYLQYL